MVYQESETVELKSVVVDDIRKEIIAFANCEGGKLYIGVQDDGTVVGLDDPDGAALQVSNIVRDAIKPDLTMFVRYETLNENENRSLPLTCSRGRNARIISQKRGCVRKACLFDRGIPLSRRPAQPSGA